MEFNPLARPIFITSKYGVRVDPITGRPGAFHNGIDLRTLGVIPCHTIEDGKIVISKVNEGGPTKGYGYYVVVEHVGFCTVYGHLNELGLPVDTVVKKGQQIGRTGNSGASTAHHLHFEVRRGGYTKDFFAKNARGEYLNGVDPTTFKLPKVDPLWHKIVREKMDSHERWINIIEELIEQGKTDQSVARFFPEFIEKLARR